MTLDYYFRKSENPNFNSGEVVKPFSIILIRLVIPMIFIVRFNISQHQKFRFYNYFKYFILVINEPLIPNLKRVHMRVEKEREALNSENFKTF